MKAPAAVLALSILFALTGSAQERIASDFEIESTRRSIEKDKSALSQLAGYLNLGDLYATRSEHSRSREAYEKAVAIAASVRLDARRNSDLTRYATATSYAGLASAKSGRKAEAFDLFEEALRYLSSSASTWNLYASAMTVLGEEGKAIGAAENAVTVAEREAEENLTIENVLDVNIYRYTLATALARKPETRPRAENLLEGITTALESERFAPLRDEIERSEAFEVFSTTRSDAASYLSLLVRSRLRLARLYEDSQRAEKAREQYQHVLRLRTDDPQALAGLSRVTSSEADRRRYFREAFRANPFSLELINRYEATAANETDAGGEHVGDRVRAAVAALAQRRAATAVTLTDKLLRDFPGNDIAIFLSGRAKMLSGDASGARRMQGQLRDRQLRDELRRHIESASRLDGIRARLVTNGQVVDPSPQDLEQLMSLLRNPSPEDLALMDKATFSSLVTLDLSDERGAEGTTVFESGRIGQISFRFSVPTAFAGSFTGEGRRRLTYRIIGISEGGRGEILLLEPLRLESLR